MNLRQIAVFMIRLMSLQYLFMTVLYLTYLPEAISRYFRDLRTVPNLSEAAMLSLKLLVVRLALHLVFALALYAFARPLAQLITEDLELHLE